MTDLKSTRRAKALPAKGRNGFAFAIAPAQKDRQQILAGSR
ncbi:hypothetical protein LJR098_001646 [Rhizobium sp. LjRoot98]|nr:MULTISPECIES: hypothetical protein [unclassified Rhizobium]